MEKHNEHNEHFGNQKKDSLIAVDFLLPYVVTYDTIHMKFSGTLYLVGNTKFLGEWDPDKGTEGNEEI